GGERGGAKAASGLFWCRGRSAGDHWHPLTWANTGGDGRVGCPAYLRVASLTWGRASRGGSGLSGPWQAWSGRWSEGWAGRRAGKEGAGKREGAAEGRNVAFAPLGSPLLRYPG